MLLDLLKGRGKGKGGGKQQMRYDKMCAPVLVLLVMHFWFLTTEKQELRLFEDVHVQRKAEICMIDNADWWPELNNT